MDENKKAYDKAKIAANNKKIGVDKNNMSKSNSKIPMPLNNKNTIRNNGVSHSESENEESSKTSQENTSKSPFGMKSGGFLSGLTSGLNSDKNKQKETMSDIGKAKKVKQLKITLIIFGGFIAIFILIYFMCVSFMMPSWILGTIAKYTDKFIDFFTTASTYDATTGKINDDIKAANAAYNKNTNIEGIFDEGILYSTLSEDKFVDTSMYTDDAENTDDTDSTQATDYKNVDITANNANAFYALKEQMLGADSEEATMIYALIGYKVTLACSAEKPNLTDYSKAIGRYFGSIARRSLGVELYDLTPDLYPKMFADVYYNIANNGVNYLAYDFDKTKYNFTDVEEEVFNKAFNDLFSSTKVCSGDTPYLAPVAVAYMDYDGYFDFISDVYMKTVYFSRTGDNAQDYTDEQKKNMTREVINRLVSMRNTYYEGIDVDSTLSVTYDADGKRVATLSGTGESTQYLNYTNNIAVGTIGTAWKQKDTRWGGIWIGTEPFWKNGKLVDPTMENVGCYVTSIATLMANSGTKINSDTFDPGTLGKVIKENGGFTSSGELTYGNYSNPPWISLAPNFKMVSRINISGKSKKDVEALIIDYLSKGYYVVFEKTGHFIAVTGVEGGKVVFSDPGIHTTPTYLDDSRYVASDFLSLRIFKN